MIVAPDNTNNRSPTPAMRAYPSKNFSEIRLGALHDLYRHVEIDQARLQQRQREHVFRINPTVDATGMIVALVKIPVAGDGVQIIRICKIFQRRAAITGRASLWRIKRPTKSFDRRETVSVLLNPMLVLTIVILSGVDWIPAILGRRGIPVISL